MTDKEQAKIEEIIDVIDRKAKELGLTYCDTEFLITDEDQMDQISSYVLPVRFNHWSFGKRYQEIKTMRKHGLGGYLYECVINTEPAYGFLRDANNLTEMKLVIAHVFGHVDFFCNNAMYARTNKKMGTECAMNASKIAEYSFKYGEENVERWLDACLAVAFQCDLSLNQELNPNWLRDRELGSDEEEVPPHGVEIGGEFNYLFESENKRRVDRWREKEKMPSPIMEPDLLLFLMHNRFADLEPWQRDVMSIVREEARYFIPNIQTKIMNEGWATYWHKKIIETLDEETGFLSEDDDDWFTYYAATNARVLSPSAVGGLNPYFVGYAMWNRVYDRWENPSEKDREDLGLPGGEGNQKMFEVRATMTDVDFIRNFIDEEVIEELDLFVFQKLDTDWMITGTNAEAVKDVLAKQLIDAGLPPIYVIDDDYEDKRQLFLAHDYEGKRLNEEYARRTLGYISRLWKRPVILKTVDSTTSEVGLVDGEDEKRYKEGEELTMHILHDGSTSTMEVQHDPIRPITKIAKDHSEAKWHKKKIEERRNESSDDDI